MRFPLIALVVFANFSAAFAAERVVVPSAAKPIVAAKANRLFCRTGSENRPASQNLELYFQYHLPVIFEPEDHTVPFGRQIMVLQGRPLMQIHFKKSAEPAGDNGEKLDPMTCAFAKRVVAANEPHQVQVFFNQGQINWLTQTIGQRPGPKALSFERGAAFNPQGDWAFASQFDKVFYVDLDDTKTFVTVQMPKAI